MIIVWKNKLFRTDYGNIHAEKDQYAKIKQAYSTLPNWQYLKTLVIGTDTLSVTEEFIPVNRKDGLLNHYVTTENYKILRLGDYYESKENVFKKKTQRILTIYYPLSNAAGDIRSCVIHSMENMNDGQFLELLPSEPIIKFIIWIKWIDNFNNMHDLEFYEGCGADIRL